MTERSLARARIIAMILIVFAVIYGALFLFFLQLAVGEGQLHLWMILPALTAAAPFVAMRALNEQGRFGRAALAMAGATLFWGYANTALFKDGFNNWHMPGLKEIALLFIPFTVPFVLCICLTVILTQAYLATKRSKHALS